MNHGLALTIGGVSSSIQDSRRRVLVRGRKKNPVMERSSTELRCASFLAPLCGVGGLSRVKMNAQKPGALDSLPTPKGEVYAVPGKPYQPGCLSRSGAGALVAHSASPQSETCDLLDAHPCLG